MSTAIIKQFEDFFGEQPYDTSRLHPDLKPYLMPGPMGTWLKHPLVFQMPPVLWKLANQCYEHRRAKVAEYEAEGRHSTAVWLLEKPYRLHYLMDHADALEKASALRETLGDVWTAIEHPSQYDKDDLVETFRRAGFIDDKDDERRTPPEHLVIYRGVNCHRGVRGLSWTTDKDKAIWFARRYLESGKNGRVYQAEVRGPWILAMLAGRGESEVVVDPAGLFHIKKVASVAVFNQGRKS